MKSLICFIIFGLLAIGAYWRSAINFWGIRTAETPEEIISDGIGIFLVLFLLAMGIVIRLLLSIRDKLEN